MSIPKVRSKVKVKKPQSESDLDESGEHELFHYANDRVQLMKEVLKLLKPKKIKAIAPDFMKNLDIEEINSMLLEELLGISNKRLKNILNGVSVEESSSGSEDEIQPPIDIISLDDISDVEDFNSEGSEPQKKIKKMKKPKGVEVKTEKTDEKERLMSVLEILELQARARAIRSQLALENRRKNVEAGEKAAKTDDSDIEEIVVQGSRSDEIVIVDSENENMGEERRVIVVGKESKKEELQVGVKETKSVEQNKSLKKKNTEEGESGKESSTKRSAKTVGSTESNRDAPKAGTNGEEKLGGERKVADNATKVNAESSYTDDTIVINLDTVEIEEMEK